jgi:hypothetical protein
MATNCLVFAKYPGFFAKYPVILAMYPGFFAVYPVIFAKYPAIFAIYPGVLAIYAGLGAMGARAYSLLLPVPVCFNLILAIGNMLVLFSFFTNIRDSCLVS